VAYLANESGDKRGATLGQDRTMELMANTRNLAALSNSIFANLKVPGAINHLDLPENTGARECLLLIDGMGLAALNHYSDQFPIFKELQSFPNLNSHFPSTTATNISSLGTGVLPGVHGMLGYTVRVPRSGEPGRLLNSLKWDDRVDPVMWQKVPTLFERAVAAKIAVWHIAAKRFEGSGFTNAALRGAKYLGANQIEDLISGAVTALEKPGSFAYLYVNDLDHAGHQDGVGSDSWLGALGTVAKLITGLASRLPKGSRLWVTADHGMINVEEKIVLGFDNDLMDGVTLVGGEPRARHIYVEPEKLNDVVQTWRETLIGAADIFTKADAISAELFGAEVSGDSFDRMGDLIAIAQKGVILVDPSRVKEESKMVGHHGGLLEAETQIPLLNFQN
jgi:Type I phosphodiesterase / nucleotide pyrophosphatase